MTTRMAKITTVWLGAQREIFPNFYVEALLSVHF